jgi:HPt (histidine-containing phosphotransfer) domain-containing protein
MSDAQKRYEKEQQKLARQRSGEPDPEDIRITAPVPPEVNPVIYKDVEPLLTRGFLTLPGEINGVHFVFKSLNQHEFEAANLAAGKYDFQNLFLAFNIYMVDGQNILPDRGQWISQMADMFANLAPRVRQKIVRYVGDVNRRASDAVTLTEAFVMETSSRFRWAQLQGLDMTSPAVTGVAGTEHLGLNWAQLVWRALNFYEDQQELVEREWDNAKFIGSCFAGKGVSKIYAQDNDRRRKVREDRIARRDQIIRHVLFGEPLVDAKSQKGSAVMITAKTTEELASQLERSLRGEKDWHDEVIEAHERRVREGQQKQQQRLAELAEIREKEWGNRQTVGETDFEGLTAMEVQRRLRQKGKKRGVTEISEQDPEKIDRFMHKWGLGAPVMPIPVRKGRR